MSDISSDLQIELEGLEYEIQTAKNRLPDYSARHFNTHREYALMECFRRAVELSEGCILCTKANLIEPQYILTRGLIERLIWVCWITKSNENAQNFIDAAEKEFKRRTRITLNTGHGRVTDTTTHEDKTQELLNSEWVKDIQPRMKIYEIAKDVGLEKLYIQIYGPLSIYAHGYMLESLADVKDENVSVLAAANGTMACINLVVKNWIVSRHQAPMKEIYAILG